MNKLLFLIIIFSLALVDLSAQTDSTYQDTTKTQSVDLLNDLNSLSDSSDQLLPKHMLFTQRILWGKKGMMRHFNRFELTLEKRQRELKVRRTMLITHQIMGFATLGGMVGQGFVGAHLYKLSNSLPENDLQRDKIKSTHEMLAGAVDVGYFATAALSLFAPPKMFNERKGYSSIKIHKALAVIHLSSMVLTNILADLTEENNVMKKYHRAAAYTAFGSFAAAMIIIKF